MSPPTERPQHSAAGDAGRPTTATTSLKDENRRHLTTSGHHDAHQNHHDATPTPPKRHGRHLTQTTQTTDISDDGHQTHDEVSDARRLASKRTRHVTKPRHPTPDGLNNDDPPLTSTPASPMARPHPAPTTLATDEGDSNQPTQGTTLNDVHHPSQRLRPALLSRPYGHTTCAANANARRRPRTGSTPRHDDNNPPPATTAAWHGPSPNQTQRGEPD